MGKIIVIGSAGAGKSTFSKELADKLSIKVYHLDCFMWKPRWEVTERDYQIEIQRNIMRNKTWIIDGNYNGTMTLRMDASDTIIFLDVNRWVCLYRVIKRFFQYKGKSRPDMQKDCPERLNKDFLKFVWYYPKKQKLQVEERLDKVKNKKQIVVLRNKREIRAFLNSV